MGRPRGFDESTVLETVRDQFWIGGYEATSIDDIMKATGIGKGSLYNAFGSKRDLYLRIFAKYCRDVVAQHRRALAGGVGPGSPSPLTRIERHVVTLAHSLGMESPRRGCFLSKATVELAGTDRAGH
jgi:TetR/AcrR family transcriptional repressor of nem operon